jgi:hypothetical protein
MLENYLMPLLQQDMAPGALFFGKMAHSHTSTEKSLRISHALPVWIEQAYQYSGHPPDFMPLEFCMLEYVICCLFY